MTGMRSLFVLAILGTHGAFAADGRPELETPGLRQRAEDLARAASQRFTDILEGDKREVAQTTSEAPSKEQSRPAGPLAPVWDWLHRSAQSYDDVVIAQLKSKDDWTTIVEKDKEASPPVAPAQPELRGWSGLVEVMRHWLARANSAYRNEIVTPLRMPAGTTVPADASPKEPVAAAASGAAPPVVPMLAGQEAQRQQDEEAIKREAEAADKQRGETEAAAAKRAADEAQSKQRAETADAQRRADEEKRRAAAAEEMRKAQAEARARLIKEAEDKRAIEEAGSKRKAEADAKRVADEAAAKRKTEEMRRQAEEADAAERRAVAEAEAEAKRKAEIDAEATRRMQAAAQAKDNARVAEAPPAAPAPVAPPGQPATTPADRAVEGENSGVAVPSVPEKKPESPRDVAKATANSREEAAEVVQETPSKPRKAKRVSAKSGKGKKLAYGKKVKRQHAYKHRPGKGVKVLVGKHRWRGEVIVGGCACRCGKAFFKPRRHRYVVRDSYLGPRHYVVRKHRGARLTHRHRLHYID